ncbi:MAG: methyltransferase [Rhodospirillaceae bacterium]|nr:MAG: methyltransferase [Rhodospirillaceae bacterium]
MSRSYTDPRLAAVYDRLNPPNAADHFYLDLVGDTPRTVLDMGCGTGWLACEMAGRGHLVTGVDPAPAMLDVARGRPGGRTVTWITSDAVRLALEARFDLIVMTGHVFQVFLEDEEIAAALANLRRHLSPDGRIAFETRNAAVRAWENWTPEQTATRVHVPAMDTVDVHYALRSVDGPFVTFETHFQFSPADSAVTTTTLRFMVQNEVATFLAGAGLANVTWYGDWNRSPLSPQSREIIAIAGH